MINHQNISLPAALLVAFGCAVVVGAACSSTNNEHPSAESTPAPTQTETGSSGGTPPPPDTNNDGGDGTADAGGDPACQALSFTGAVVMSTNHAEDMPGDTGGTIAPGTYDLTALDFYPSANEGDPVDAPIVSVQASFIVTSDMIRGIRNDSKGTATRASNWSIADIELVTSDICPRAGFDQMTPFTATASSFTLHTQQRMLETYTRRQ